MEMVKREDPVSPGRQPAVVREQILVCGGARGVVERAVGVVERVVVEKHGQRRIGDAPVVVERVGLS